MDEIFDLLIIGSGPAGLAAAIYAQRARLHAAVIEKLPASGGQVLNTLDVDNYPGLPGVGGYELGMKFRAHADHLGALFMEDEIIEIKVRDDEKKLVVGAKGSYVAKAVIVATGATHRKLGVPGEEELKGRGVSYCATCDGAFFRNKTVAVVGGGDVALEDGIFLSRMCKKVYLIHRRDRLRGAKILQEALCSRDNVEVLWDTVVGGIQGSGQVEGLRLRHVKSGQASELPVQGVFIAVGITPQSSAFADLVEMEDGYIRAGEDCATSVPGIFAAGDVRTTPLRQVLTAAADGANAVVSVERYLAETETSLKGQKKL